MSAGVAEESSCDTATQEVFVGPTQDMENYRPVSNLGFASKLVERVVVNQLMDYLTVNDLVPKLQSAY